MRSLLDRLYALCGWLAGLCLVSIGVLILAQIVCRLFGVMLPGADDLSTYAMVGSIAFGLPYTLQAGGHIQVTLLLGRLPRPARWLATVVYHLLGLAMLVLLAWYGVDLALSSLQEGAKSQGNLPLSLWPAQAILALGLCFLLIAVLDSLVQAWRAGPAGLAAAEAEAASDASTASPPAH